MSIGAQKLGQPVPESNLVLDEKSGAPQHTHLKRPVRFSLLSGLEKGRSVPGDVKLLRSEQFFPLFLAFHGGRGGEVMLFNLDRMSFDSIIWGVGDDQQVR